MLKTMNSHSLIESGGRTIPKNNNLDRREDFGTHVLREVQEAPRFLEWSIDLIAPWIVGDVLEVGAGLGNNASYLQRHVGRLCATDINPKYVEHMCESLSIEAFQWNVTDSSPENLPKVQTVFCSNVLEHVEDDRLALTNIRELKAMERMIIIVPHLQTLYCRIDKNLDHFRRYSRRGLSTLLTETGFRPIRLFSFNRPGTVGWFLQGKVMQGDTLGSGNMRLYNRLTPLFRRIDNWLPWPGLSLIAIADPI